MAEVTCTGSHYPNGAGIRNPGSASNERRRGNPFFEYRTARGGGAGAGLIELIKLSPQRTRANALRDKLEENRGEVLKAQDAADQARQHVREAEAVLAELRQADADR